MKKSPKKPIGIVILVAIIVAAVYFTNGAKFSVPGGATNNALAASVQWASVIDTSTSQSCYRELLATSELIIKNPSDDQWNTYLQYGIDLNQSYITFSAPFDGTNIKTDIGVQNYPGYPQASLPCNDNWECDWSTAYMQQGQQGIVKDSRGIVVWPGNWNNIATNHKGPGMCTYAYHIVFAQAPASQPPIINTTNPNPPSCPIAALKPNSCQYGIENYTDSNGCALTRCKPAPSQNGDSTNLIISIAAIALFASGIIIYKRRHK
jgi:hypothetical protein